MREFVIEENGQVKKEKISVWDCLKKQYPDGQFALMQEVSNAAGFDRSGSADFIAMSLWPSRGLTLEVIELKSYRGDWLNELRNPRKQETFFKHADYFWLLTIDETIASIEEIPSTWGWMCIKGKKITIKKNAPKLEPEPINKSFLAALLKRASCKKDWIHKDMIEDRVTEEVDRRVKSKNSNEQYFKDAYDDLQSKVKEFERESGLQITYGWHKGRTYAKAIKTIETCGEIEKHIKKLENLNNSIQQIQSTINHELSEIKNIEEQSKKDNHEQG